MTSMWVQISQDLSVILIYSCVNGSYIIIFNTIKHNGIPKMKNTIFHFLLTHQNTNFLTLQRGAFKSPFRRKWQFCTFVFYSCKLIFIDFNTYPCCAMMLGWSLKCLFISICGVIHPKERSVQGFTDAPIGSQIWFFHLGHEDT